ncbi:DNA polymerase mu [Crepidotus variabilis]|uniref:DNA-directed DNA polymerase n=1 Tax=Crepidotus variabilis TaxID=179855 RepID=A0A9P6EIF7_9AGAR|nr:DNA polymerase mu [Crepidotus variabilis]
MSPKRSTATRRSSSSASDSEDERASKRFRECSPSEITWKENRPLKVYVVQTKIEEKDLQALFNTIESTQSNNEAPALAFQLVLASEYEDADIIITSIRMKKRLERHVSWDIAQQKAIVTPDWLYKSIEDGHLAPCGSFAALRELQDQTAENCPDDDCSDSQGSDYTLVDSRDPKATKAAVKPTTPKVYDQWSAKYACQRASPLVCVNQELAAAFAVLSKARELEGMFANALSYERTAGIIKSYPHPITKTNFRKDVQNLPGLGQKTLAKVEEWIENGYIQESTEITSSERFQSLSLFSSIYGIGPVNARKLYDLGLRSIEDLERYYDVSADTSASTVEELEEEMVIYTPNGKRVPTALAESPRKSTKDKARAGVLGNTYKLPDMSIKVALMLRGELDQPIPRDEVEEMHRVVMKELQEIQKGCISTIVGGYRRGKSGSNDVDIVITHPDLKSGADMVKGLCKRFTQKLHSKGLVTHVMHLSSFHAHNALRTSNWDSLEKALTVFLLPVDPKNPKRKRTHRRLDLIFAAPEAYWTAVVGWSGSKLFERDLRSWAKDRGLKFDSSGLTRRHDSKLFLPRSEQEVFDILGLDWIDPTMRNANA